MSDLALLMKKYALTTEIYEESRETATILCLLNTGNQTSLAMGRLYRLSRRDPTKLPVETLEAMRDDAVEAARDMKR